MDTATGLRRPDYAVAYALNRLCTELSARRPYHKAMHTEGDVVSVAGRLVKLDLHVLEVAAALQDLDRIRWIKARVWP
ncbi:MAG: hypothetical protein Q8L38_04860 [Pseudohongiella sp.]|nr:hypothetical protein [Pseudohongiella sp.]